MPGIWNGVVDAASGNTFWASPADGSSAVPSMRGLDYADVNIPALSPIRNANRRCVEIRTVVGGTGFVTIGDNSAFSVSPAASSNADGADYPFVQLDTSSVSGNSFSSGTSEAWRRNWAADATFIIKTGSNIGNVRLFVGFTNVSMTASDAPTGHIAGFRYATGTDGTAFWRTYCDDNTSGNRTTFATSTAIATSTTYVLRIRMLASSVEFYINGTLVHVETTGLPGAANNTFPSFAFATVTTAVRSLLFSHLICTQA